MAVKHIKAYYNQISQQYADMLAELHDFEELAEQKLFSPEKIEEIKESIIPLKNNFERWSYMMYLLNLPNRKSRQPKYHKQHKIDLSKLDNKNSIEATVSENTDTLNKLRSDYENLSR